MRYFAFIIAFCLGLMPVLGQEFTQMTDINSFKELLKENSRKIETLQTDFVQKKHLSFTDKPIQSSGKFYFKKEQNIRWETQQPNKNIVVITKDFMKISDGKKTQQFDPNKNKMFAQTNEIMMIAVTGELPSEKNYKFRFLENNTQYKIILFPLSKVLKEFLKEIHIVFLKSNLEVVELKLVEPSGDFTQSNFKNRVMNKTLPSSLFDIQ